MTQFVGIAPDDTLDVNAYYRVVIEKRGELLTPLTSASVFQNRVRTVYTNMYARTGFLVPVSPNPVKPGDTGSVYVIDVAIVNSGDYASITALEAVRRIEGIAGGHIWEEAGYDVREFRALDDVSDVRDNGPAERQAITAQVEQQKQTESPFANIGQMLTLVVIAVVALAAIQISKDL